MRSRALFHPCIAVVLAAVAVTSAVGATSAVRPSWTALPAASTGPRPAPAVVVSATIAADRAAIRPVAKVEPVRRTPKAVRVNTGWPALDAAIAHIPGYRAGVVKQWVVRDVGGWGATQLATRRIFISPGAPRALLYSIAVHEYVHALAIHDYGSYPAAAAAARRAFGGSSLSFEYQADCGARALGATWTHYTPCTDGAWKRAATKLVTADRP